MTRLRLGVSAGKVLGDAATGGGADAGCVPRLGKPVEVLLHSVNGCIMRYIYTERAGPQNAIKHRTHGLRRLENCPL